MSAAAGPGRQPRPVRCARRASTGRAPHRSRSSALRSRASGKALGSNEDEGKAKPMLNSVALLGIGVIVTALLVCAVWWGIRRRAAEPPPGSTATPRDPVRDVHRPEVDGTEFPADGSRRTAHELKGYGNLGTRGTGDDQR
ncbi:DUF6479 family protein [Streptomyces sp. NBC_00161]|uniref:DUF6479 family protein n=1 Tax=Streptomyces sp. NBC_00161 TaxID=2975671 RepID=UPI003868C4A8